MKKVSNWKLIVGSVVLVFLLLTSHFSLFTSTFAATPAPSPNPSDKLLLEVQQMAASKAAQLKAEVSQKIQNKAFIGPLIEIKDKTLTINTKTGAKTVLTDEYTVFQDTSGKKAAAIAFKDLAKDNYLVALGDMDDKGVLTAKKITRIKKPEVKEKFAYWGKIQSVLPLSISLVGFGDQKLTVSFDKSTIFKLGTDEASVTDAKPNNFLITLGSKLNQNSTNSTFIYLLNPTGSLAVVKPSASASASPSAIPKKK